MKTTLNLPDDLMRAVKMRAARENRTLQDLIAELLRLGLVREARKSEPIQRRTQFPLIQCGALPDERDELTPEQIAEVLLDEEARESLRY